MTTNISQLAAYIWNLADLLRGDFKQSQYGRIILPFTILRRLECVLEANKAQVLAEAERRQSLPEEAREKFLLKGAGQSFYNTSPMDLSRLGTSGVKDNLLNYVQCFSKDAREIFEHFRFEEFVLALDSANLLFKVVQRVAGTDLHPASVSNHEMGLVFEELIRRFAEGGGAVAIYSSELSELVHLCDRCAVIYRGRIQAEFDRAALSEENLLTAAHGHMPGDAERRAG